MSVKQEQPTLKPSNDKLGWSKNEEKHVEHCKLSVLRCDDRAHWTHKALDERFSKHQSSFSLRRVNEARHEIGRAEHLLERSRAFDKKEARELERYEKAYRNQVDRLVRHGYSRDDARLACLREVSFHMERSHNRRIQELGRQILDNVRGASHDLRGRRFSDYHLG